MPRMTREGRACTIRGDVHKIEKTGEVLSEIFTGCSARKNKKKINLVFFAVARVIT